MNVAAILRNKGAEVVTARANSPILEIASLLRNAGIGAVVISSDRIGVEGILSERDIVRALAARGEAALHQTAGDLMTREVKTCGPDDRIAEVMARMTAGRFRHMPVMDDGAMIGIVSIGDVVRMRVDEIEHEAEALREYVTRG